MTDPLDPTTSPTSDVHARIIAADWHGGQGTALYAFVSTGAISLDLPIELADTITQLEHRIAEGRGTIEELERLNRLVAYVTYHGTRDAQPDWHELTW